MDNDTSLIVLWLFLMKYYSVLGECLVVLWLIDSIDFDLDCINKLKKGISSGIEAAGGSLMRRVATNNTISSVI